MTQKPTPRTSLIFDLDSTVLTVYGRLEGARIGYNPFKRGRPSYHPLVCFEGESRDAWHGIFRPGDAHTSRGSLELLRACFAKVPPTVRRIRVRGDVGFYNHKIVEFIEENQALFAIVAKMTRPIQIRLSGLKYRQIAPTIAVSEFRYQPHYLNNPYRFVVVRKELPQETLVQLTLFHLGKYAYHVIATNMALKPENVWRFYNDRAGVELIIKELKGDYPLTKIPTKHFLANEIYFDLILFAYNLLNWFKRLCLPKEFRSQTLKTLRTQLLNIPGELVRPKGRPTLKLPSNFLYRETFIYTLRRIQKLHL